MEFIYGFVCSTYRRLFISQKKLFKNYQSLKYGKNLLQFLLSIFKHDTWYLKLYLDRISNPSC